MIIINLQIIVCRKKVLKNIQAAQETNLPIIVHTRDAEENTYEILERMKMKTFTGVLHCFTGSYDLAKKTVSLGLYISASGIITFKKCREYSEVFCTATYE